MSLRNFAWVLCLIAAPAIAEGPKASFDCAKARTAVEKAICTGEYLPALDRAMDELYRAAQARTPAEKRGAVEAEQRLWLAARDARCGKPDSECLMRVYKDRIISLARSLRELRGAEARGSFITGRYRFREKGLAGEMFLAELPNGAALVMIETVAKTRNTPTCSLIETSGARNGDRLVLRDESVSKVCGLEISVMNKRAVIKETPNECFELATNYCGMAATLLGVYERQ